MNTRFDNNTASLPVSRREFLGYTVAAGALSAMPKVIAQMKRRPERPNIILLLGDDHRWDALGCAGNSVIHTPELDRLAGQGVMFRNHFATTPICCASRASIMTGQYAGTHGIYDFSTDLTESQIRECYWMRLKEAGYNIGFVGKYGVGEHLPAAEFDYWKGFPGFGFYFPNGPSGDHLTNIQAEQANEFLKTAPRDKPFCLSVSFKAPHIQDEDPRLYLPSNETLSLYENTEIPPPKGAPPGDIYRFPLAIQRSETRRRWGTSFSTPALYQASMKGYYRLVSGIDAAIGSIRKTLEAEGLADNTIIIYSADHGVFHNEHGFAEKWYGHEESLRIPLILYDPRATASGRGQRRETISLNIDLAPTILELAGVKRGDSVQGRSLLPLLGRDEPEARRIFFFEHHLPYGGWIPSSDGIRTERWKYIRYTDTAAPFEELYDLANDQHEIHNLAGQEGFRQQQHALAEFMETWRDSLQQKTNRWTEPVGEAELKRHGLIL
jgi:arylsulfatase A-like enzyme